MVSKSLAEFSKNQGRRAWEKLLQDSRVSLATSRVSKNAFFQLAGPWTPIQPSFKSALANRLEIPLRRNTGIRGWTCQGLGRCLSSGRKSQGSKTSSHTRAKFLFSQKSSARFTSSWVKTLPVGLWGEMRTKTLQPGVHAFSKLSRVSLHPGYSRW